MARYTDPSLTGFKIEDLLGEKGITFEIGEHYNDNDDDDDEFSYSPYVQYSNQEILDMLNMNDFDDELVEDEEKESASLYGISFAKLKTKMMDITTDQKVKKYIKQNGVGEIVPHNAQVTIHYIGYFEDRDEPFDSSYSCGRPKILRLGQGCIVPGLEMGISTMRKHEKAIFLIHPDYAYKAIGCPPRIPPNEEVVFVVYLMDFLDDGSADTYKNLSIEEKKLFSLVSESVRHMLAAARDSFAKFNIKKAIRDYKRAVDCLEKVTLQNDAEEQEFNKLLSRAYTNLGICYNKMDMPRSACMVCNRVPIPTAKTHYTFGKALLNIAEYNRAMQELHKAYKLLPGNEAIEKVIQQTNIKQRQYLEIEKRLWKNCFKFKEDNVEVNEFRKAARDLCKIVIDSDGVMRQPLPEGFTEEECQIVREEAAILGLDVVTHLRYGKEIIYVQKANA